MLRHHFEWQKVCGAHGDFTVVWLLLAFLPITIHAGSVWLSMASPESAIYSPYYHSLDDASRERYKEKIAKLRGLKDPYLDDLAGVDQDTWGKWPALEYPDIFCYLIQTTSEYTGERLKAYKSLDSYNFFVNGWIAK